MNPDFTPLLVGLQKRSVGHLADGTPVHEYRLDNGLGLSLQVLDLGGIVTALHSPDRAGQSANVALGLARLDDYLGAARNFGSLVGRYAGRIDQGRFTLDGQSYQLSRNEGAHTLHGGALGLGTRVWQVRPVAGLADGEVAIELSLASADGDQGFPGGVQLSVRYTLTRAGEWRLDYRATCDAATVLNPTHHVYWNLAGSGSIEQHRLTLAAPRVAELDATLIPQALVPVAGTPFDFRHGRRIADGLRDPHPQMQVARGYDHYFAFEGAESGLAPVVRLEDPASGRVLEIATTEPGVQLYTGNFLNGSLQSASGQMLRQGDALCLETQRIGNAPNRAQGPNTVLRPGEVFTSTTVHRLGVAG